MSMREQRTIGVVKRQNWIRAIRSNIVNTLENYEIDNNKSGTYKVYDHICKNIVFDNIMIILDINYKIEYYDQHIVDVDIYTFKAILEGSLKIEVNLVKVPEDNPKIVIEINHRQYKYKKEIELPR